jgi:hypothetical protein
MIQTVLSVMINLLVIFSTILDLIFCFVFEYYNNVNRLSLTYNNLNRFIKQQV